MGLLGSMTVRFGGDSSALNATVSGVKSLLGGLPPQAALAVGATAAVVGSIVAIGVTSVKMAGEYEQGMNKVKALTGSSDDAMRKYDTGVKQLAVDAGVGPAKLTDGLYNVLSASYKGATAMQVLTLATEDSKIGMTSATVTTDALTNVLRAFSVQNKDITRTNGEMLETVTLGKSTFEEYASRIVKAADASVQFKVSMETMNAAWSTMTSAGIHGAQATTDFVQSLKVMYSNIGTVTASLHKSGIAFNEAKFNAMSYGDKIVYLNKAVEQANEKHVKVTGVTLQAAQALSVISNHINDYNHNLAILSDKQAMAQKTQQAWAITQNGFNQTMDRVKASIDVLFITIGQQIIPILTKAAQGLVPLIDNFSKWASSSNGLGGVLKQLGTIIQNVWKYLNGDDFAGVIADFQTLGNQIGIILGPALSKIGPLILQGIGLLGPLLTNIIIPAVDTVVFELGQLVMFFEQNHDAATLLLIPLGLLGGYFLYLGVTAIISFIASVPAMVAGFLAGAAAAWTMAVGVIAATWPFLAIGLAIGIVVAIVILAIQHWGAITAWLKGVWGAFTGWFMGILGSIGAFFQRTWAQMGVWVQAAIAFIQGLIRGGFEQIKNLVLMPINDIVNAFKWLYDHNYYFQHLVDKIKEIFTAGFNWLKDQWNRFTSWLGGIWNGIKNKASEVWGNVSSTINSKTTDAGNSIKTNFGHARDTVNNWGYQIGKIVVQTFEFISQVASKLWSRYLQPQLATAWQNIQNFFNGWPKTAVNWGVNLIQGFINGIGSMLGNVGTAAQNIMSKVAGILGFHSPAKEGPGKELDIWGPNMVKGFASGIDKAAPMLRASIMHLVAPMEGSYPGSQNKNSASNTSSSSSGNNYSGDQHIYIQLDGDTLTHVVSSRQAKLVRLKQGRRAA